MRASIAVALFVGQALAFYNSRGPITQLDFSNFDRIVNKPDQVTVVEFYAPCKSLAPTYEKLAHDVAGLINVAAIDCNDDTNRATCAEHGVQGFPTIKVFEPVADGRSVPHEYRGLRTVKSIADFATNLIPNHVVRMNQAKIAEFLSDKSTRYKGLLFSKKGATSATYKALALKIPEVSFAMIRDKETDLLEQYGVESMPTFLVYDGESGDVQKFSQDSYSIKNLEKFVRDTALVGTAAEQQEPVVSTAPASPKPTKADNEDVPELDDVLGLGNSGLKLVMIAGADSVELVRNLRKILHEGHLFRTRFDSPLSRALYPQDDSVCSALAVNAKRGWSVCFPGDPANMAEWMQEVTLGQQSEKKYYFRKSGHEEL